MTKYCFKEIYKLGIKKQHMFKIFVTMHKLYLSNLCVFPNSFFCFEYTE